MVHALWRMGAMVVACLLHVDGNPETPRLMMDIVQFLQRLILSIATPISPRHCPHTIVWESQ